MYPNLNQNRAAGYPNLNSGGYNQNTRPFQNPPQNQGNPYGYPPNQQNYNSNNQQNQGGYPSSDPYQNQNAYSQNLGAYGYSPVNPMDPTFQNKHYNDDQQGGLAGSARSAFVQKVYMVLCLQLLFTVIIGLIAYNSTGFQSAFVNAPTTIILSVILMGLSFGSMCCSEFFRRYALFFLILFTLCFSFIIGIAICGYKSQVVLTSVAITFGLVVVLTLYACFTKTDLTQCGAYLCIFGFILMAFGIVCIFWKNPIAQLVYACLGALMFGVYLVFNTQLVLGKFQNSYSLDDVYLAALALYTDIVQLFMSILQIVGRVSR